MKKFTRIMALVFAMVLMTAMFAGCGANTDADKDADKDAAGNTEKEVLVMATNAEFPPYEYYEGEEIVGIDAEVAALIAEKLGMELQIEDVDFDSIIPGVQSGKYDMGMAGMTVTDERLESVNFSDSYATGIQVVIVKEGSDMASLDDIADKMIGVQQGTTGAIYASDDYGDDHVTQYNNGAVAVEALKNGKLAGAGLDVLAEEPPQENHPLIGLKNCRITPHIAFTPVETRKVVVDTCGANLKSFIEGGKLNRLV